MFARVKKSGRYEYLQIVENRKIKGKVRQRVVGTLGRMDQLQAKDGVENLVRSLARFSEKTLLVLSAKSDVDAQGVRIGPALIFQRLWDELGLPQIFRGLVAERRFEFEVERAIFLTVLHRLFEPGSDRSCNRWREGYAIEGVQQLALHHSYRAMAYLGEVLKDQSGATPFAPRCVKDLVEEKLFARHRDLFTALDLVFFDTTSIYFEGEGGETIGQLGNTKDRRPDCKQMVVGVVLDDRGRPICCEMWPGNTADVKTLVPVVERLRKRFHIGRFCIVADRGMISADTMQMLERPDCNIPYILGARMRRVKEVWVDDRRYIVCKNSRQARKDAATRQAIIEALEQRVRSEPKKLIGNRGYARYLKMVKGAVTIDRDKIDAESRFDGKWVLRTNMNLSAEHTALRYKELWTVERVFRDVKSILETRPIFHKCDETIRGHVFCSFLALVMRKELDKIGDGPHRLDSLMGVISSKPIYYWRHQAASRNG
jgi:transposase